jgi:hypothetical protein
VAFPNASDIIATTIDKRSRRLADNVTKNNALLMKLKQKGKIRSFDGGATIVEELTFAENGNFGFYAGYDLLPVAAQDVISYAQYSIKQAACPVIINGLEMLQNAGRERFINLLEGRMTVAESTMKNNLTAALYSDGTGYGGKQLVGLAAAVPTAPTTGTYGGIDRAVWPFWRPAVVAAAGYTSATIQGFMNTLYFSLIRGADKPDIIIADTLTFTAYLASLQSLQRFTQAEKGSLGFPTLQYMMTDVVLDGGVGGFAPANSMWMLNTDYIFYRPHEERDMVPLSPNRRVSINQDAEVQIIAWAGNMTVSNSFLQGFLKGF